MMKKLGILFLSVVMILFMASAGMAGQNQYVTDGGGDYEATASIEDSGWTFSDGIVNLGSGDVDPQSGQHSASVEASQTADVHVGDLYPDSTAVDSSGGHTETTASGEVSQHTFTYSYDYSLIGDSESSAYALSDQESSASFETEGEGPLFSYSGGNADVRGSSFTEVKNGEIWNKNGYYSFACSVADNEGRADSHSGYKTPYHPNSAEVGVEGSGLVESGTYVYNSFDNGNVGAMAQSNGAASFNYGNTNEGEDLNADVATERGGSAVTCGESKVYENENNGHTAESWHFSASTTGSREEAQGARSSVEGSVGGVTNSHNVDLD